MRWNADLSLTDHTGRSALIYLIRGAIHAQPHDQNYADVLKSLHVSLGADHVLWTSGYIKEGAEVDPAEEMRALNYERKLAGLPSNGKTCRAFATIVKSRNST